MPIRIRSRVALWVIGSAVACFHTENAGACRVKAEYLKLSLEQKVSKAKEIFIGRVVSISSGKVVIAIEETLRGPHVRTRELKQWNSMCTFRFVVGARVFYAGNLVLGPTRVIHDEIPADLASIVDKLRKGIALDPAPIDAP